MYYYSYTLNNKRQRILAKSLEEVLKMIPEAKDIKKEYQVTNLIFIK